MTASKVETPLVNCIALSNPQQHMHAFLTGRSARPTVPRQKGGAGPGLMGSE
jgi:hypothetical protein